MSKAGELKYVRVANLLREEILSEKYRIGEILPGQQDLAKRFKINRATVKLAEDILEKEGILRCIPSVGAIVTEVPRDKTLIGYLVKSLHDPFHQELIRELDRRLSKYNAAIILAEGKSADRLLEMGATKIIKGGQLWNTSSEDRVKTVYVGNLDSSLNCVSLDNYRAIELLYRYLKDLGHERISFLSASIESTAEENIRLKALHEICPKKMVEWTKGNSFCIDDYSERELTGVLDTIARSSPRITALICSSDWLAIEAMQYTRQRGINIPGDLSISGFDNIYLGSRVSVPLTTVNFPREKAAEAIIEILFSKDGFKPVQTVIEPELIIRESISPRRRK